jgi:hypothetical protein
MSGAELTDAEKALARSCAKTLIATSEALAPLALGLDSIAELLTAAANGAEDVPEAEERMEAAAAALNGFDFDILQMALVATVSLIESLIAQGKLRRKGDTNA